MQDRICSEIITDKYDFSNEEWYINIEEQNSNYKKKLLKNCYFIAIGIILLFILDDILSKRTVAWFNYSIAFFSFFSLIIHYFKTKNLKLNSYLLVAFTTLGFFAAVILPNSRNIYIFIFFTFPLVSFQLLELDKAKRANALFLFIPILIALTYKMGLIHQLNLSYNPLVCAIYIMTYLVISILAYTYRNQNIKNIQKMIRSLLYPTDSNIPNRLMLEGYKMDGELHILVIIQLNNHSELRTIFGYDAYYKEFLKLAEYIKNWQPQKKHDIFIVNNREIVLLGKPGTSKRNDWNNMLKDLYDYCQKLELDFNNTIIHPRIKLGGVCSHEIKIGELLNMADSALKSAITSKTNYTLFCGNTDHRQTTLHNESDYNLLVKNINRRWAHAVFQPIISSQTGHIAFYECLCRIKNNSGQSISIYPFIKIAETTGLNRYITQMVVRKATEHILATGETTSVNIDMNDLETPGFMGLLAETTNYIDSRKMILEILESSVYHDQQKFILHLYRVKEMGFRIAIDDFGSGYSNYSRLCELPVDIVKIDGQLVKQAENDPIALILVETIIDFCHKTGKEIVAEWIENEKIYNLMKNRNVHFLQGFYLGKPAPGKAEKIINSLTNKPFSKL